MNDQPDAPLVGVASPTADHVRIIMRAQNIKLALGAFVLAVVGGLGVYYSAGGKAASDDSYNATSASLAGNARNACITERRNLQADALGRISISANQAEVAGLVTGDDAEALRQLQLFKEAVADWTAASESLAPGVLDQEPPVGCGPPILSLDDLPDEDPTSSTTIEDP